MKNPFRRQILFLSKENNKVEKMSSTAAMLYQELEQVSFYSNLFNQVYFRKSFQSYFCLKDKLKQLSFYNYCPFNHETLKKILRFSPAFVFVFFCNQFDWPNGLKPAKTFIRWFFFFFSYGCRLFKRND